MRKTTIHSHKHLTGRHVDSSQCEGVFGTSQQLDTATDQLNGFLSDLEKRCAIPGCDINALTGELTDHLHRIGQFCRAAEDQLEDDKAIRRKQAEFRRRTDYYFSKSFLVNRARTWPRGYPGDYEIIDAVYDNQVLSKGIGQLFDRYFLETTLARAIQQRRATMRDMLAEEIRSRQGTHVLNIGCGPCREILELASLIKEHNALVTNIDFDSEALLHSARLLTKAGIANQVRFRQYNAMRMVNARKNVREFGYADVIYTIGLLDYLSDEVLIRLIKSLYATLKPGGVLIAVFKDSDHYDTEDYHWLSDWSAFLQRDAAASRALLDAAGVPADAVTESRTSDDVMIFYRAVQTANTALDTTLQGPHERRKAAGVNGSDSQRRKQDRGKRPSWHKPTQTH